MLKKLRPGLAMFAVAAFGVMSAALAPAEDQPETHIHLHVVNDLGKPVGNAEVVVRFLESRFLKPKKKMAWELRTTQDGTVSTPGIPQGKIVVQINASNYQTYGETFDIEEVDKTIEVKLMPPQPQYSSDPAHPAK